jgi:hypothetical protein
MIHYLRRLKLNVKDLEMEIIHLLHLQKKYLWKDYSKIKKMHHIIEDQNFIKIMVEH